MTVPDAARWLDGNAAGGLLAELLGVDPTGMPRTCGACGQTHAIATHRLYIGAGLVLRCPGCEDVALVVTESAAGRVVRMAGSWTLRLPASDA
jgi:hypothetical protein